MSQAEDSLAKKRFFAITAMRLMGAFFVLIGFVLIRGGWELAGQPTDRWIGVAVVLIGAITITGEAGATTLSKVLGFIAVTAATVNAVSGFLITDRMLKMFKPRGK